MIPSIPFGIDIALYLKTYIVENLNISTGLL
jgi:hypothetical protein